MAEMKLPKAPADITPGKFFNEWLPEQMEPIKEMISSFGGGISAALAIRVTGDNGGDWSACLDGGEVKIEEGLKSDAVVTFVLNEKNFVEAVTGEMEDLMPPPPEGSGDVDPAKAAEQAKSRMETVKNIQGSLKYVIEDDDKPFEVMIKFAGDLKDEADVSVIIDRENALAMAKGETNPQAAFMSGQIKIQGDMSILMQLTPLMM